MILTAWNGQKLFRRKTAREITSQKRFEIIFLSVSIICDSYDLRIFFLFWRFCVDPRFFSFLLLTRVDFFVDPSGGFWWFWKKLEICSKVCCMEKLPCSKQSLNPTQNIHSKKTFYERRRSANRLIGADDLWLNALVWNPSCLHSSWKNNNVD